MFELQGKWLLSRVKKTVYKRRVWNQRLITFKYCLMEAGVVGDGGWIKPQFFTLFSELGSIQFCLRSKIDICLWSYI